MRLSLTNYNNLTQRIITGSIGAVLVLVGCTVSEWTYFVVFFVITGATIYEFYQLSSLSGILPSKPIGILITLYIFTMTFLVEASVLSEVMYYSIFPSFAILAAFGFASLERIKVTGLRLGRVVGSSQW